MESEITSPTVTSMNETTIDALRFDIAKIAATLPETATTLLVDHYLTNREAASARSSASISKRLRTITQPATSISTCSQAEAHSGWKMKAPAPSSAPESWSF